jgi:predicted nucleic acid-binding protein
MIIADTSIWIDHLRTHNQVFGRLLVDAQILIHPFVVGELAVGNLKDRNKLLRELADQPKAKKALDTDVLVLIDNNKLFGRGIGYVDAHLLASARICEAKIWTTDKRLHTAAVELGLASAY